MHTLTSRLFELRNHRAFPHPDTAPEKHALNCIRVLTRVIPFLYEADHLEHWKEQTFWQKRRRPLRKGNRVGKSEVLFDEAQRNDVPPPEPQEQYEELRPLGEELVDTLVDLLFYTNFTLPPDENSKTRVTYSIWQSGVGCNTAMNSSSQIESNRSEVLRLLLTLSSEALYLPARAYDSIARLHVLISDRCRICKGCQSRYPFDNLSGQAGCLVIAMLSAKHSQLLLCSRIVPC